MKNSLNNALARGGFQTIGKLAYQDDRPIALLRDARIAYLQGVTDIIFSLGKEYQEPNSVDITEFFRSEERFSEGYDRFQEALVPALSHRLSKIEKHQTGLNISIEGMKFALGGEKSGVSSEGCLSYLEERINSPAYKLLTGTFLSAPEQGYFFEGKNVIVTGADTGIGRAVALEFLRRGAKVALHYPSGYETGAESVVDLAREAGLEAMAFEGDFRDKKQIKEVAEFTLDYLKKVDIFMNNAGITLNRPLDEVDYNDFNSLMNVNLASPLFMAQSVVDYMPKGSVILNMSSDHGLRGKAGHSVYAATKAGIIGLTRGLAIELAPRGIRVNAVTPGWAAGVNHFKLSPELDITGFAEENTPLGKITSPQEFARSIIPLFSEDMQNLTGQTIELNSGMNAGLHVQNESTRFIYEKFGHDLV